MPSRRSIALLVALAVLAPVARRPSADAEGAAAAWEPAKTWALLIGVLEWEKPGLVSFPKKGRVDRVLEKALYDRGVPRDHVTFVEDKEATLARCREALEAVAGAAGPGSTLLLYYAGHGARVGAKTFFCPYDMDPKDAAGTGLGHDEIGRTLAGSWKGTRLLLMADSCYSGGLGSIVASRQGEAAARAASLTSSLASNVSTGNWTFTESVVTVLEGGGVADGDGDGTITFDEADLFVRREMRWKESQLTEAHRSQFFEPGFVLSKVDPARARKRVPGPRPVGDYAEVEWKGDWWKAQVLDARADGTTRVHYLGFEASWDEWVEPKRMRSAKPIAAKPGDLFEIEWEGKWWPGSVRETRDEFALVHYDAYGPEWDEWVGAKRLRPRK